MVYYKGSEKNCFSASLCLQYRTEGPVWSQASYQSQETPSKQTPARLFTRDQQLEHSDLSTTCLGFLSCLPSFFDSIVSCRASLFSSYVRNLLSQLIFPTFSKQKRKKNIYKSSLKNVVKQCIKELVCFALLCFLRVMSICHPLVGSNRAILVRTNTRVFEAVLVLFTS